MMTPRPTPTAPGIEKRADAAWPTLQPMTRGQRNLLGLITVGLMLAGVVGWATGAATGWPEILVRVAIVLAAIWLAAPGFDRVPRRVAVGVSAAIAIIAFRPRQVLAALAIGAVVAILWRRQ